MRGTRSCRQDSARRWRGEKVVHHDAELLIEEEGTVLHHVHHALVDRIGQQHIQSETLVGEGIRDTPVGLGQCATSVVDVFAVDVAVAVLVLDLTTTDTQWVSERTEGEGYTQTRLGHSSRG